MSRFASPVKKHPQNLSQKSKKEFLTQKLSKSHSLPPPPPPYPPENEETKSIASSISSRRSRSTNNGWISERSSSIKPIDSSKTILLTKQFMTTLQEDTVIDDNPQTVLFPSRVYERSELIRQSRHEIVCIQSDWQRYAYQAMDEVQQLNLDIIQFREASAALSQQTYEKEAELTQKKSELEKLYAHLSILEKEALKRGIKWMRPPLIRSVVPTVSPRNIVLSLASAGANLGNSQPSDVNWKLELSQLIDATTSSRPVDDSFETKSDTHDSTQSGQLNAKTDPPLSKTCNIKEFVNSDDFEVMKSLSPSNRPHRPAPRVPLSSESYDRYSPPSQEFLTIDDMKIPFDKWIPASTTTEGGNSRSTTPIKWKAEKLKLSALIPPPLPPPPPPPPPYYADHNLHSHEDEADSEIQDSVSHENAEEFEFIHDTNEPHLHNQASVWHTYDFNEDDEDVDLIEFSRNPPFHQFTSPEPLEPLDSDDEDGSNQYRYIPTQENETTNREEEREDDESVREWYSGEKISPRTHIPNFNPSERIEWENAKQNEIDPGDLSDEEEVHSSRDKQEDITKDEHELFEELKEAVSKNKWCRNTLSRLSMFDQIHNSLQKTGTCHNFIKSCNPDEFSPHEEKSKTLRLTVGWLENIAHKLKTFWAFPERKFLMECLHHFDGTGKYHIRWLSRLFFVFHPNHRTIQSNLLMTPSSKKIHDSSPESKLFESNGYSTTLLPSHNASIVFAGDDSTITTSTSGNKLKRRTSVASAAPALTRQLSQEDQENASAAALSSQRNKYFGDLTRKERRGSMLRAENDWNPNFAFQSKGTLQRQQSSGLEASDSKRNDAVRSSQFAGVAMPSFRTHTTNFENALGGRGEDGVGRNWTGSTVGAKGMKHDLQKDAQRTTLLLRELSSDCYQVFLIIAKYLKVNCIPVERVETDFNLHFPHGYLDDRDAIRTAIHLSSGSSPPAKDVLLVQKFLQKVIENPEGQLENESNNVRRSGVGSSKKLMQWRDFILVVRSIVQSYGQGRT